MSAIAPRNIFIGWGRIGSSEQPPSLKAKCTWDGGHQGIPAINHNPPKSNNSFHSHQKHYTMKHKIFDISLALLFLMLFSCKKDMPETQLLNAEIKTPMLSEMDQYLLEFKQKMGNPLKSGELMSLDDARWHLSATLNFSYADTKMDYEILPMDTIFVSIPLQNGQVSMEAFSNAFVEITGFLSARYHEIEATEKTLNLVSVSISSQADDQAELMAVAMMGYNSGLSWGYPFSEGHWWYWGYGLGRCGPYEGENIGSDGAKRLTFAANLTVPVPDPGRVYWTDEVTSFSIP
jgi:hypothetical protein